MPFLRLNRGKSVVQPPPTTVPPTAGDGVDERNVAGNDQLPKDLTEPIVWLIDMGYVIKTASKAKFKLDNFKAAAYLEQRIGCRGVKMCFFNSFDESLGVREPLQGFYDLMRSRGAIIRLHPMSGSVEQGNHRQRCVDVDLATHGMRVAMMEAVSHLVLTSGDFDFSPMIEMIKRHTGKTIWLFTFDRDVSTELVRKVGKEQHLLFEHADCRRSD